MPEYWHRMKPHKCNLSLLVEGPEVHLSTWDVDTDFIVPEKNESQMSYSCERRPNIARYKELGPKTEVCKGMWGFKR